jgi:hypothetical protein
VPPIFIWDPNDLTVFSSVEEAGSWLEPVDVDGGGLAAYDSEGRLLRLFWTKESVRRGKQPVLIEAAEDDPIHSAELERILRTYLSALGVPGDELNKMRLPELKRSAVARAAVSKKHRSWWNWFSR